MEKFKVGDEVEVIGWSEICEMGNMDSDGDIKLHIGYFYKSRKKFCGKSGTIVNITDSNYTVDIDEVETELKESVLTLSKNLDGNYILIRFKNIKKINEAISKGFRIVTIHEGFAALVKDDVKDLVIKDIR